MILSLSPDYSADSMAAVQGHIHRALAIAVEGLPSGSVVDGERVSSRMATDDSLKASQQLPNTELSRIGLRYCHEDKPRCNECPLQNFCVLGRRSQISKNTIGIPFIDLFAGAGGLSLGLESSEFRPAYVVDIDSSSLKTYSFNRPFLPHDKIICSSIEDKSVLNSLPKVPIVVGGPPCQGFSNANRQRLSDDPRNKLYKSFLLALRQSDAQIAIMENVPLMMTALPMLERDFLECGFLCRAFKIDALEYGLPQNRQRVFVLAVKTSQKEWFKKVHNLFQALLEIDKIETMSRFNLMDAIGDLPLLHAKNVRNKTNLENDQFGHTISRAPTEQTLYSKWVNSERTTKFLFNHRTKYNNPRDIEIYGRLKPGEDSSSDSIRDINPYASRSKIFKDKFYKLVPEKHCKTITAHMYYDCHMYIHPNQARGLTPREAARIQGFPDDYLFLGYPNEWYRQIGNAVSPIVSRSIGRALRKTIDEMKIL